MAKIGKNVLENLTQAMYNDSRIVYREYIQNSTDQIDIALKKNSFPNEDMEIIVEIDTAKRNISIKDNANGIPKNEIKKRLEDVADSEKIQGEAKGFRGIGRLGGIGYCKELRFITTYAGEDVKTTMVWNASLLREIIDDSKNHDSAEKVLEQVIRYEYEPCSLEDHFFEVKMLGVNVEDDKLIDVKAIRQYLAEVSPVPFKKTFIYKSLIEKFINENDEIPPMNTYSIKVRGNKGDLIDIYKDYPTRIKRKGKNGSLEYDEITNIQTDIIRNSKGEAIAWIWFAISSFKGALVESLNPWRCLRLRQFNIQIGDSKTLSESPKFFPEDRSYAYFMGEVHTLSKALRPNARRDYFNETLATRDFEDAIKEYFKNNLSPLYKAGSEINSSFDHVKKAIELEKEYRDKQHGIGGRGFSSPTEKKKMEADVESAKEKAVKAAKKIKNIIKKTVDDEKDTTALSKMVTKVMNERKRTDKMDMEKIEKIISSPIILKKEESISKSKVPLLVDTLSTLNNRERKLVSKIYDIISKQLPADEAKDLISRIQEGLKNKNVS